MTLNWFWKFLGYNTDPIPLPKEGKKKARIKDKLPDQVEQISWGESRSENAIIQITEDSADWEKYKDKRVIQIPISLTDYDYTMITDYGLVEETYSRIRDHVIHGLKNTEIVDCVDFKISTVNHYAPRIREAIKAYQEAHNIK